MLNNVDIVSNEAFGSGAGLSYDCNLLHMTNGSISNNNAISGGALEIGGKLVCGTEPIFRDVAFKGNSATTGGVAYFRTSYPSCAIPVLAGEDQRWNMSMESAWYWDDFDAFVMDNSAALGSLQATSPVAIVGSGCAGQGCEARSLLKIDGFPGLSLSFGAMLLDSFNQVTIDDTLQVELVTLPGSTCLLDGILQHRITYGVAQVQSVKILAETGDLWNPICKIMVRLPLSIISLRNVAPLEVHVQMGMSAMDCPPGWISAENSEVAHSARECQACPAGSFAPARAASCTAETSEMVIIAMRRAFIAACALHICSYCSQPCCKFSCRTCRAKACPAGRFNQDAGAADCLICPAGCMAEPILLGTAQY